MVRGARALLSIVPDRRSADPDPYRVISPYRAMLVAPPSIH